MTKTTAAISPNAQQDGISQLVLEFDPASDGWFLYAHTSLNEAPVMELWHMTKEDALAQAKTDWDVGEHDWSDNDEAADEPTLDANGAQLQNGDDVTLIKDLPVKGAGVTIKRGTTVKNISLTNNPEEIDCKTKEVKNLVLKSCFVKRL